MKLPVQYLGARTVVAAAALLTVAQMAWALEPFKVQDIRVEGLQRVEAGTVFASIPVRVGDEYDDEKGTAAIRALFALGLFKDVRLEANGDVLVAESNAPAANSGFSLKGWIAGKIMARAGAGVPSANRITLLRDQDHDGIAETRTVFLKNLNSPFGMALVGKQLYVANTDSVWRFAYEPGATQITAPGVKVIDLPAGALNHHWTKNVIASADGKKLYVTVGSNSNVGENGLDAEQGRAAIWEVDRASGQFSPERIADVYGVDLAEIRNIVWFEPANAVKVVMPRRIVSGAPGDSDVYGAQQHAPLLNMEFDL